MKCLRKQIQRPPATVGKHGGFSGLLCKVRNADNVVEERHIAENPHRELEKGKGIKVAEWLVSRQIDEIRLREMVRHKGPAYVFADAGLSVVQTGALRLDRVMEQDAWGQGEIDQTPGG